MSVDTADVTTETTPAPAAPPWWRTAAPEDFRARVATMTRADRESLHAEMDAAMSADRAAINAALAARAGLADAQRKWLTLGALTSATAFDKDGKPVGPLKRVG